MIHIEVFRGYSEDDCIRKINDDLKDDQIINVIPGRPRECEGYDEYDSWTEYSMKVIYKDLKNDS